MLGDLFVFLEIFKEDKMKSKEDEDFWMTMAFIFLGLIIGAAIIFWIKD